MASNYLEPDLKATLVAIVMGVLLLYFGGALGPFFLFIYMRQPGFEPGRSAVSSIYGKLISYQARLLALTILILWPGLILYKSSVRSDSDLESLWWAAAAFGCLR